MSSRNAKIYSFIKRSIWLGLMVFIFSDAPILSAKDRIPVQWTSSGGVAEPNGQVNVVLPDGAGNVYVGGRFTVVGQIKTPYLAKWNGTKWSAVGLPNSQIEEAPFYIRSEVLSLALGPDGSLYVGGYGMTLNGITGRCLLKWDGSAWTDMSGPTLSTTSPSNFVDALSFWNGHLIVSGRFSQMGGISASNIALWNGNQWSDMGGGMNGSVSSCVSFNGLLYAAGSFSQSGGIPVKNLARWNGSSWSAFDADCDGRVNQLTLGDNGMLAAGAFRTINGTVCNGIAKFDGASWSSYGQDFGVIYGQLSGSSSDYANKVAILDGTIYAIGGRSYTAPSGSAPRITQVYGLYRWSGTAWDLISRGNLRNLAIADKNMYVCGGLIFDPSETQTLARSLIQWDGFTWKKIGSGLDDEGSTPTVKAVVKLGDDLFAAGAFNRIGAIAANSIARWDGDEWHPLNEGVNGNVESMVVVGTDLFVAGDFTKAGGADARFIARWDGSSWHPTAFDIPGKVNLLYQMNTQVFAACSISSVTGATHALMKWNGSTWSVIMNLNGPVEAMIAQGDNLLVGGNFKTNWPGFDPQSGGLFCYNLMSSKSSPLGVTFRQGPISLIMHQGEPHASGLGVSGLSSGHVCKWNGLGWSALGRGKTGEVRKLKSINEDLTVLIGSNSLTADSGALRWNGVSWGSAEWLINGDVKDMIVDQQQIILCGDFSGVDDVISAGVIVGTILPDKLPDIVITEQPISQTVPIGERAQMRIAAKGSGLAYQWFQGLTGDTSLPISNINAPYFTTEIQSNLGVVSYWVRASKGAQYVDSQTVIVTIVPGSLAPYFSAQPLSQIAQIGESISFDPIVSGSAMTSYQWQKSAKTLSNAKQRKLNIENVKTSDAATYRLSVSNTVSSEVSEIAFLAVLTPPSPRLVLAPQTSLKLKIVNTTPSNVTLEYIWFRDGISLSGNNQFIGATTNQLENPFLDYFDGGHYSCRVTATLDGVSITRDLPGSFVSILPKPELNGLGSLKHMINAEVSVQAFAASLEPPLYSATGLPAGLIINPSTGLITGRARAARLVRGVVVPYKSRIMARNSSGVSAVMEFDWTIDLLGKEHSGNYQGVIEHLFFDDDSVSNEIGLEDRSGGFMNCTMTSSGAFSGSLLLGRQRFSFSKQVQLEMGTEIRSQIEIKRPAPLPNVLLSIRGGDSIGKGLLSVTMFIGSGVAYGGVYLQAKNSAWVIGRHNCALGQSVPSTDPPTGYGFTSVTLSSSGSLVWAGRLPDSTVIVGSSRMRQDGYSDFYQCINSGLGSLIAQIDMNYEESIGSVLWFKARQSNTRNFPDGISLRTLELAGKKYLRPQLGISILGPIRVDKTISNAALLLSGGGLSDPLAYLLHLSSFHSIRLFPNSDSVTMAFNSTTGLFSGRFTQPGPTGSTKRIASYYGLWIPNIGAGVGFFQLPEMPKTLGEPVHTTNLQSGSVLFINASAQDN